MADTSPVILVAGTASVPASYVVPPTQELSPLVCNATFDGTNAAGSFLPTLEIVSDGGVVIARCPVAVQDAIAAGDSAEVTFAPFLRQSRTGSGYVLVEDEGTQLPAEPTMDFVGPGVTAADDPTNRRTTVKIPGASLPAGSYLANITSYTTAGDFTYTVPTGAVSLDVICVGSGGGGGGGITHSLGTLMSGSTGGGGGCVARALIAAASVTATVAVHVPAGGTGGAAGSAGTNGDAAKFGGYLLAGGGGFGSAGSTSISPHGGGGGSVGGTANGGVPVDPSSATDNNAISGQAAPGGVSGTTRWNSEWGGAGGAFGANGSEPGGSSIFGGPGGGMGGATFNNGAQASNGGAGGGTQAYSAGQANNGGTSGNPPTAGGNGTFTGPFCGQGGGGGGFNTGSGAGATGGNGSTGAGGGGGGSGAGGGATGGNGGDGYVTVIAYTPG